MNHSSVSDPLNQSLRHWIQLNLNGDVSDSVIYSLVRRAYDIVKEKYQKRRNESDEKSQQAEGFGMGSGGV